MKNKYLNSLFLDELNQIEMTKIYAGNIIVDGCIAYLDLLKEFWDGFCVGYRHEHPKSPPITKGQKPTI